MKKSAPDSEPKLSRSAECVRSALDKHPGLTYEEFEKLLGFNEQRVYRAINELEEHGIVVEKRGKPKCFSLPQELRRSGRRVVSLNEEEILALRLAAQVARSVFSPTPIAGHLQSAFQRLLAEVDERGISIDQEMQGKQWHFGDAPSAPIDPVVFDQLRTAIRTESRIRIDYYAAQSEKFWPERRVTPQCIAASSGTWWLIAWCHERNAMRDFNLVDIRKVSPWEPTVEEEETLTFPKENSFDPDDYFRDRFRYLSGDTVHDVKLLVEPHQARYFKRKYYHPTQMIEQERDDGRIVVSYEVEGLDELRSFAQSWGTGVTVLQPEELRRTLEEQAEEILRRYRGEGSDESSEQPIERS